jgi:hypothetical protein
MAGCTESQHSLDLVIELFARHGHGEVLTWSSSARSDDLAAPGDFRSTGGGLDGRFLALIPDQWASEYPAPEQPDSSSSLARHLRQRTASGEIGVPVFDDAELVAGNIGHGGIAVLRDVTVPAKPRPEPHTPRDGLVLIVGPVSEVEVKAIPLLTVRSARGEPKTYLSRLTGEQNPTVVAFRPAIQHGSPELRIALRILRAERHRVQFDGHGMKLVRPPAQRNAPSGDPTHRPNAR